MKSLSKEVTLTLIVKLILLYLLWLACFSHPVSKTLNTQRLAKWLVGTDSARVRVESPIGGTDDPRC